MRDSEQLPCTKSEAVSKFFLQMVVAQEFTCFEKGRKLKIFLRWFSSFSFQTFLSFSDSIGGFCHCDRVQQLLSNIIPKTLLTKAHSRQICFSQCFFQSLQSLWFFKIGVLRNFAEFTGKHLCQAARNFI